MRHREIAPLDPGGAPSSAPLRRGSFLLAASVLRPMQATPAITWSRSLRALTLILVRPTSQMTIIRLSVNKGLAMTDLVPRDAPKLPALALDTSRFAEAPSFGLPIGTYDPKGTGAEDYRALAAEVLGRWKKEKPHGP